MFRPLLGHLQALWGKRSKSYLYFNVLWVPKCLLAVLYECEIRKFVYIGMFVAVWELKLFWGGDIKTRIKTRIIFNLLMARPSHRFQWTQTYMFHIHITQSLSVWDPTMHWNIDSSCTCFPRGPEDDLIKVETCRPDNTLFLLYIK